MHMSCIPFADTAKILDTFLQINAHALTVNTRSSFCPGYEATNGHAGGIPTQSLYTNSPIGKSGCMDLTTYTRQCNYGSNSKVKMAKWVKSTAQTKINRG